MTTRPQPSSYTVAFWPCGCVRAALPDTAPADVLRIAVETWRRDGCTVLQRPRAPERDYCRHERQGEQEDDALALPAGKG